MVRTEKQITWQKRAWSKALMTTMISNINWILRTKAISEIERKNLALTKHVLNVILNEFQENSFKLGFKIKKNNKK